MTVNVKADSQPRHGVHHAYSAPAFETGSWPHAGFGQGMPDALQMRVTPALDMPAEPPNEGTVPELPLKTL